MIHRTPLIALLVCGLLVLGCPNDSGDGGEGGMGGEMGTGGMGGDAGAGGMGGDAGAGGGGGSTAESCGADTACTPDAPSACGTLCQDICGGFDFFLDAGCGEDNRCFCVCMPSVGICTE